MSKTQSTLNYKAEVLPWFMRTFRSYDNQIEWRIVPVDEHLLAAHESRLVTCHSHPALMDDHVLASPAERGRKALADAPLNRISLPAPAGYRDQDVEPFVRGSRPCDPREVRDTNKLLTLEDLL